MRRAVDVPDVEVGKAVEWLIDAFDNGIGRQAQIMVVHDAK